MGELLDMAAEKDLIKRVGLGILTAKSGLVKGVKTQRSG